MGTWFSFQIHIGLPALLWTLCNDMSGSSSWQGPSRLLPFWGWYEPVVLFLLPADGWMNTHYPFSPVLNYLFFSFCNAMDLFLSPVAPLLVFSSTLLILTSTSHCNEPVVYLSRSLVQQMPEKLQLSMQAPRISSKPSVPPLNSTVVSNVTPRLPTSSSLRKANTMHKCLNISKLRYIQHLLHSLISPCLWVTSISASLIHY